MTQTPIEAFTNPLRLAHMMSDFSDFYKEGTGTRPEDFPTELTSKYWWVAFMGWLLMQQFDPSMPRDTPQAWQAGRLGVPEEHKPLCDLHAGRGFLAMVGTVALVLDLGGFDQAAVEFVRESHHMEFDTGQLFMLAYDYVKSITSLDPVAGEEQAHE